MAEEASGLIFKDWLDFTVLLAHSGGMFWMKATVTINFKRMKSSWCWVLLLASLSPFASVKIGAVVVLNNQNAKCHLI